MNSLDTVADIAFKTLHVRTLETRKSDSLDFHVIVVWELKEALLEAYKAGRKSHLINVAGKEQKYFSMLFLDNQVLLKYDRVKEK